MLVVISGRADAGPLRNVILHLREDCSVVREMELKGSPEECLTLARVYLEAAPYDIMVLLGDRYETLGAAYAAAYNRIPIAHIHGGESTYGAMDDSMRHAISKLSHLHFVANKQFADVLNRMGEKNIFISGAPGLDNLVPILAEGPRNPHKYFVVTYHPETLGNDEGFDNLVNALKSFPTYKVMWTGNNNDPGAEEINQKAEKAFGGTTLMSADGYLRACKHAACVIGNSSSGIIECLTLGVPTVNIGERQRGRPQAESIITTLPDAESIWLAIKWALEFKGSFYNPYGKPGASKKIAEVIAAHPLKDILKKSWSI